MKKSIFILLSVFFSLSSYAQTGGLFVGAQGGYVTHYKNGMYGLNLAYQLADPVEISFTGLLNPSISLKDEFDKSLVEKLNVYSFNLDMRYYLMHMSSWGMGPVLGYQYQVVKNKSDFLGDFNTSGFNIGWHIRADLTDDVKLMGGWRYTMAKEDAKHHYIYLGIGYTFSLF
jgi:hypothetical protein